MQLRRFFACPVLAVALGLCIPVAPVDASGLRISPLQLLLDQSGGVGTLRVGNAGNQSLVAQLEIFRWRQGADSNDLEPTRDLLATPPIIEVAPQSKRNVRVGLRSAVADSCETAYRVAITEIPQQESTVAPIHFRARMVLPIFVQSASADCKGALVWSYANHQLRIINVGNAHVRVREILVTQGAETEAAAPKHLGYFLPGASQTFAMPSLGQQGPVQVEALIGSRRETLAHAEQSASP